MYNYQNENPYELEEALENLKAEREELAASISKADWDAEDNGTASVEVSNKISHLDSLDEDIAEMKDRINYAWQDDEAECDARREAELAEYYGW